MAYVLLLKVQNYSRALMIDRNKSSQMCTINLFILTFTRIFTYTPSFLNWYVICLCVISGILQKGDGTNIYLKHKPRLIITTMGDGRQRALECSKDCSGTAVKQRLLAPVALVSAPDGSIFVGDFNLVRKINTDGTVRTIVKLK